LLIPKEDPDCYLIIYVILSVNVGLRDINTFKIKQLLCQRTRVV